MTFHAFTEYIKYQLKAKGRHGTHSPFVYKLVDQCLLVCNGKPLEEKLKDYFADTSTWLADTAPHQWRTLATAPDVRQTIIIPKVHSTASHTLHWKQLIAESTAKMSIDLFNYGLLISKDEFKEKQHFVLKYC